MPLSWSDIDALFPSARAAGATAPLLSPEEEESILRRALQTTGSALGAVGNVLDLPGSMVRDVLTLQNPFDQLLSPMSSQNRATGRDILTQFGMAENDPTRWELGDFLGFGVEVGLDPLTYATFGGSALSKAGKLSKKAGLLDDLAADVSKRLGRKVGKREARAASTLNDLLSNAGDAADAMRQNLRTANKGADLTPELLNTPLGGTANFFGNTFGTGDFAQNYLLRPMDRLGAGIAASGPGRMVRGLFDPSVAGNMSLPLQEYMPDVVRTKEAAKQAAARETLQSIEALKTYMPDDYMKPETNAAYKLAKQKMRSWGEDSDLDDLVAASKSMNAGSVTANDRIRYKLAERGLPELNDGVLKMIEVGQNLGEESYQELLSNGMAPARFVSSFDKSSDYVTRDMVQVSNVGGKDNPFRSGKQLPLSSRHNLQRDASLDWVGGDHVIDELSKDIQISGPSSLLKDETERLEYVLDQTAKLAPGDLDPAAIREVVANTKKSTIHWKPADESEKALHQLATDRGLDPTAVRNIVDEQLNRDAAESLWDSETYSKVVKGRMSPSWWKKLYTIAAKGGDRDQIKGFDSLAKSLQAEGLIPETVEDAGEAAWNLLVERGSPTEYRANELAKLYDEKKFAGIIDDHLVDIGEEAKRLEGVRSAFDLYEQAGRVAAKMKTLPDEYSQYGVGLFEKFQPEVDAGYRATAKILNANARAIQQAFADSLKSAPGDGDVLVGDAIKMLGISDAPLADDVFQTGETLAGNFLKRVSEFAAQRGGDGQIEGMYLPADVVRDATKTMQRLQVPESVGAFMQMWDKFGNWTKDLLTLSPGFVNRNLTGGHVNNWLHGVYDGGLRTALRRGTSGARFMANQPIKNIEKTIPMLKEQGMTNEQANAWFREQLAVLGTVQADDTLSAASTIGKPGATSGLGYGAPGTQGPLPLVPGAVAQDIVSGEKGRVVSIGPDGKVTMRAKSGQTGNFYQPTPRNQSSYKVLGQAPGNITEAFGGDTPIGRFQSTLGSVNTVGLTDILKQTVSQVKEGGINPLSKRWQEKWNPINVANVGKDKTTFVPSAMRSAVNTWAEANVRVPAFLSFLEEGYTPEMAAKMVADMHVDYSALTPFEKTVMRRVVPFYSFNRRMAEYVARDLMENPGGRTAQSIRAVNNARDEDNSYIPPYIAEGTAIPLTDSRFISGFGLMHEAPFEMLATGPTLWKTGARSLEKALGMTHPLIRGPLEFATGRNFFTGRDQRDLYQFPFSPEGALGSNARYVNMLLGNSPVARQLSMARTALDERKEPWWRAVNLLSGFSVTDLSGGAERAREFAGRKAIDELLRESPLAKEFTNIYIPKDKQNLLTRSDAELLALKRTLEKRSREVANQKRKHPPV